MIVPTLPIDIDSHGLIGARSLRALQLVRIGRHPSVAMLVPRDGIWVVSGRGPKTGSNGAGKTVLLGALSLLNGDPQWRGENGIGPNAARLLFDHNRARVADVRYVDAPHGYIAGVFLNAGRLDNAVTVWMRIERHSNTHILVRWGHGITLATGNSEAARWEHANDVWSNLRDSDTLKVTEYAEALYGRTPRCIAYIRARGSEDNQDRGLLALGQRPFRPTDLASQIITLAGKQNALDNERQFRQELEASESLLVSKKAAFEHQYNREEQQLRDITARKEAHCLYDEAAKSWELYLTVATLLAYNTVQELATSIAVLEGQVQEKKVQIETKETELAALAPRDELARLFTQATESLDAATSEKIALIEESGANAQRQNDLKEGLGKLRVTAALASGLSIEAAEQRLSGARGRRQAADQAVGRIQELHDEAKDQLAQLRAGRGGPAGKALDALEAEDIPAASILDLITLNDEAHAQWEARISPYANTVLVSRKHADDARRVLAKHPGTPLLVSGNAITAVDELGPSSTELLDKLLRHLEERMPAAGQGWVIDSTLGLEIPGDFDIRLTDRQAAIRAAEGALADLERQLEEVLRGQVEAEKAVAGAEDMLRGANATAELKKLESEFEQLLRRASALPGLIKTATDRELTARMSASTAETNYRNLDQQRRGLKSELDELQTGDTGLGQLLQKTADAREKRRRQKNSAAVWQRVSDISDVKSAEAQLAESNIILDTATRDTRYQLARTTLRRAIEAVLGRTADTIGAPQDAAPGGVPGSEELHLRLNVGLRELHSWCDEPQAERPPRTFDLIAMPLTSWLDWNGADDETKEAEIHASRLANQREIEAAETQTAETRLWIKSQRDNQIAIITKAFQDTQKTLNDLLVAVGQDPIALRPRHADAQDADQPLRWELHPQWLPPGRKPVDYSNPPNTAELIILHVLLATASLVAATKSQGRMLILDESGNNLDGPNLARVSAVLQRVAEAYGLTVVLACQDLYTDRVARYGAGMIQLLRPSPQEPLNSPPDVSHEQEDHAVLDALMPYLNIGRPDATVATPDEPADG